MSKPLYAVSYKDNEGGVYQVANTFLDATYSAIALFNELLIHEGDSVCVDVFECNSWDNANTKFADELFISLLHLGSGMYSRG